MVRPSQLVRLAHINVVLVRHGLDEIILATHLFRPLRWMGALLPWNWFRRITEPRAVRIRRALEELGPIFVKFGQALSTRGDLLPDDVAAELAKLQDRVPPYPGLVAREIVEREFGRPLEEVLADFEITPLASASIAQVHPARLKDGREVIVKVLRPNVDRYIRRDLGLLFSMADLAERYWPDARRLRPREVVAEFEKALKDELNLVREAANGSQLRRNFDGSPLLYVPEVHWPLSHRNVMVMERIRGIPVSDVAQLERLGFDLRVLAEKGVEVFFTQVLWHSFFHADMHPGNIFIDPETVQDPRYIAVDFGIMGSLNPVDQQYLAENFLAFFQRDYRRVAELHIESGWVPRDTRVDEFESAIRTVCEPIFGRPLGELSFGTFLLNLFRTAQRFRMEVQPQLVLLQKTMLAIEGLGRQLYPQLDLWATAKPLLERWALERVGPGAVVREVRTQLPRWAEKLTELPALADALARQIQAGEHTLEQQRRELASLRREMQQGNRRNLLVIVGAALLISAAVLLAVDGADPQLYHGAPLLSWLLGGVGGLAILISWNRH